MDAWVAIRKRVKPLFDFCIMFFYYIKHGSASMKMKEIRYVR